MKRLISIIILTVFIAYTISGCRSIKVTNSSRSSAPGQIKKETGSQSAKPYAPGQQKKKNKKE